YWMRRSVAPKKAAAEALLAALAFGSLFITVLSPHSQSNGYILYVPALPGIWYFAFTNKNASPLKLAFYISCYFFISIAYSDLVPRGFYHWVYDHALKPVAGSALAIALAVEMFQRRRA
ncbi:hypothetical protein K2X33_04185, partial [bacterium]|nr:hypothetical protein [bacterium]